jgi:hypothetical protein
MRNRSGCNDEEAEWESNSSRAIGVYSSILALGPMSGSSLGERGCIRRVNFTQQSIIFILIAIQIPSKTTSHSLSTPILTSHPNLKVKPKSTTLPPNTKRQNAVHISLHFPPHSYNSYNSVSNWRTEGPKKHITSLL